MSKTIIYLDVKEHKYTNSVGNVYISTTTVNSLYEHKFEDNKWQIAKRCEQIGRSPNHKKYIKYKGKTASQLIKEWDEASRIGKIHGNLGHDYLDGTIKSSNSFYEIFNTKYEIKNNICKLYTIEDIISNNNFGKVNLEYFSKTGIKDKYPEIYNIIKSFVNAGWNVYSEVAVFHNDFLISGLVDVLFVKDRTFCILDWKTNKDPIKFESGYWEHDRFGKRGKFIYDDKTFKEPLHLLPQSVGNKYLLQLGTYSWLIEQFGFKLSYNILCHITHDVYTSKDDKVKVNPNLLNKTKIVIYPMPYIKESIIKMINDYNYKRTNGQYKIF